MKYNRLFLIILFLVLVAVLIEAERKQTNKKQSRSKSSRKEIDQAKRKQTNKKQPKSKSSRKKTDQTKKKHNDKQYKEKNSNHNKKADCVVAPWGNWAPARPCLKDCKKPCLVKRTRKVNRKPQKSGKKCPELVQRTKKQLCKSRTDCAVGPWSGWSNCPRSCGNDCETRQTRKVVRKPGKKSGTRCPSLVKKRTKRLPTCPEPTCEVSHWSSWSSCGRTCGGSCHRSKVRNILRNPTGKPCPELVQYDTYYLRSCPPRPIPGTVNRDCIFDHWENWSTCSKTCGATCTITRHRHYTQLRRGRGKDCVGPKDESKEVHLDECPIPTPPPDCETSPWDAWSGASCTCGRCSSSRSRTIITPAQGGGSPCGSLQEQKYEDYGPCLEEPIETNLPDPEPIVTKLPDPEPIETELPEPE